jgi:hypothetical protein
VLASEAGEEVAYAPGAYAADGRGLGAALAPRAHHIEALAVVRQCERPADVAEHLPRLVGDVGGHVEVDGRQVGGGALEVPGGVAERGGRRRQGGRPGGERYTLGQLLGVDEQLAMRSRTSARAASG